GVPGRSGADLLVGGVGCVSAGVPHGGGDDPAFGTQAPEHPLGPPEAAHTEIGDLAAFRVGRGKGGTEHGVLGRHRYRGGPTGQGTCWIDHGRVHPERVSRLCAWAAPRTCTGTV